MRDSGKMKDVGQTTSEVDQPIRRRPAGPAVRTKSLGMGQEGTEKAQGDFKGQGTATSAPSTRPTLREMKWRQVWPEPKKANNPKLT